MNNRIIEFWMKVTKYLKIYFLQINIVNNKSNNNKLISKNKFKKKTLLTLFKKELN